MRMIRKLLVTGLVAATLNSAAVVQAQDLLPDDNGIFTYHQAPRWRESESHPLRVGAYILHPIGWVFREAIFRPLSYFAGSTRFTRSFFGFREPYDYRNPMCFTGSDQFPDCHTIAPYAFDQEEAAVEDEEPAVAEEKVVFPHVAFEFDKSSLNALGKARVRQVSQMLSSMPQVKVVVEGHADMMGTDDYNIKLGTRRAETVVKELTELGIDGSRMSPISYGESRPIFTENTDWARAANRRVQFTVQGQQPETVAESQAQAEIPPAAQPAE
jgi:outer membrane protein OmpA-like peptidoglycan-associated protein